MNSPGLTETADEWKEISVDTKLPNPKAPREPSWRVEVRRILACNAYRVEEWHGYPTREAALTEFWAVLDKATPGFYGPHGDHRLVLVEDGAR